MNTDQQIAAASERPKVLAQVRHARILATLAKNGAVSVSDVASQLAVSEMTVRRDLMELERDGKLIRTHGGAIRISRPVESLPIDPVDQEEPTFESRLTRNAASKRMIAAVAASLAVGARTLALDVGTTTYLLSGLLLDRPHTKIFTNSVRNAMQLAAGSAEVYLPGGRMRGEEMSISSQSAVAQFEELWFDIAFVGVSGITAQGIYDYSFEDADMKRVYLRRATRKIVLCDSTKFKRMSLVHVGPLQEFDMLITDALPPADLAEALAIADVELRIAQEEKPLL
jgi:DeoR/GlpR family transcriptional regulator of sugar metabolism